MIFKLFYFTILGQLFGYSEGGEVHETHEWCMKVTSE